MIPFPHLNLINCVAMGQKHEYLIWREKKGFFTALDYRSNLLTWSIFSGKLLYNEYQQGDAEAQRMEDYQIYRSDHTDINYTQDFYNLPDHSITLLRSKQPLDQQVME